MPPCCGRARARPRCSSLTSRCYNPGSVSTASPAAFRDRFQRAVSAVVARPVAWALLVAFIAAWPIVWALSTPLPPPLKVLGTLPQFELTAQDGSPFGSKALAGRVWVASFIFTRCDTVCPAITRQIARIQGRTRRLEPASQLVSISVDAEFDHPARRAPGRASHLALGLGIPGDHPEAQDVRFVAQRGESPERHRLHVPGVTDQHDRVSGDGQHLQALPAEEHVEGDVDRAGHVALLVFLGLTDVDHPVPALPGPDAFPYLGGGDDACRSLRPQEEVGESLAGLRGALWSGCGRGWLPREGAEGQCQHSNDDGELTHPGYLRASREADLVRRLEALAAVVHT